MKKILFLLSLLLVAASVNAQQRLNEKPKNLPFLDNKPIHWGFTFGTNFTSFTIYKSEQFVKGEDSIRFIGIENNAIPGMFLGPILNIRMGRFLDLRFLPEISLVQRKFTYYSVNPDTTLQLTTIKVPSYFIELPVLIKWKGARMTNFRPYVIAGGSFKYDLASLRKVDTNNPYLKTNAIDYYIEFGPGFDFYFPYFKFSIELKYGAGILNNLGNQNTIYSRPIESLKSNTFMLSFHFEG